MVLREKYFFKNKHKLVKVRAKSNKWQQYFSKSLIVPEYFTKRNIEDYIVKSLGTVQITSMKEEKVICLVDSKARTSRNARSIIDAVWQDGIEYNVAVYYSRRKTAYFPSLLILKQLKRKFNN